MKNLLGDRLFNLCFLAAIVGCISAHAEAPTKVIGLVIAEAFKPGQTTKEEIRKVLGPPKEITDLGKLPGSKDRKDLGELWEYGEGENTRLSISFPPDSSVLDSWIWHVPEDDPRQNLKTAMRHYMEASWEPETVKWINPHSFPNECYFEDKKLGISIEYNRARKEVFTISRWNPSRKIASDENEKPPQYCIARDPNVCTPAISSAEFFKNVPLSKYCEIPK